MIKWYLLAGTEQDALKKNFEKFICTRGYPPALSLWKWKATFWIRADENFHNDLILEFKYFNIIEFSSAPLQSDLEFLSGSN